MPYLSCKKIENDVYNFPTWQYCKYKDIFDSRIIINSTAKFYISISYQKDLLSIDTRIFTPSWGLLSNVLGGGVAESFLYPIYGGLILLAGLIVGCTVLILEEMRSLKDKIDRLSDKSE